MAALNFKSQICLLLLLLACSANVNIAHSQNGKEKPPYDKETLLKVIRLHALLPEEIAAAVYKRGVDFELSGDDEPEFVKAGAHYEILAAIRANISSPLASSSDEQRASQTGRNCA